MPLDNAVFGKLLMEEEDGELPSAYLLIRDAVDQYKATIRAAQVLLDLDTIPGRTRPPKQGVSKGAESRMSTLIEVARQDYRSKVMSSEAFLGMLDRQEQALNELGKLLAQSRRYHESSRALLMREYTKRVAEEMSTPPHTTFPTLRVGHRIKNSDKAACTDDLMTSDLYLDMLLTNAYDVAVLDREPTYEGL